MTLQWKSKPRLPTRAHNFLPLFFFTNTNSISAQIVYDTLFVMELVMVGLILCYTDKGWMEKEMKEAMFIIQMDSWEEII